jgi:hypothetical protein
MNRAWALPAILMILIPGTVAHGQDAPAVPPTSGTLSVSFYLPGGGGGGIGVWRQMGTRYSLGLEMEGAYNKQKRKVFNQAVSVEGEGRTRSILVGPSLKRYWDPTARVAPFLYLHTGFGFSEVDTKATGDAGNSSQGGHAFFTRIRPGIGADWFPLAGVSIGGYVGFEYGYDFQKSDSPDATAKTWTTNIDTLTSGLRLNLYF